MAGAIQGTLTKISPAAGMVTKHKKSKISVSTPMNTPPNPEHSCYMDEFKAQWEVNAKGVCLLSVLFSEDISRALREKDVDWINYIGNICLLQKTPVFPRANAEFRRICWHASVAEHIRNKFKIWSYISHVCIVVLYRYRVCTHTQSSFMVQEMQSEERRGAIYE